MTPPLPFPRRALLLAALWLPLMAAAQDAKPDRAATLQYINNVLAKARGAVLTEATGMGQMPIDYIALTWDGSSKSYRFAMQETLNTVFQGRQAVAQQALERWGWTLRNLDKIEDTQATVFSGAGSRPSGELRRIKISFTSGSVRERAVTRSGQPGMRLDERVTLDGTNNFVSVFYRASDPDDGKRLRNALLRLKEIDGEEKDPFLN